MVKLCGPHTRLFDSLGSRPQETYYPIRSARLHKYVVQAASGVYLSSPLPFLNSPASPLSPHARTQASKPIASASVSFWLRVAANILRLKVSRSLETSMEYPLLLSRPREHGAKCIIHCVCARASMRPSWRACVRVHQSILCGRVEWPPGDRPTAAMTIVNCYFAERNMFQFPFNRIASLSSARRTSGCAHVVHQTGRGRRLIKANPTVARRSDDADDVATTTTTTKAIWFSHQREIADDCLVSAPFLLEQQPKRRCCRRPSRAPTQTHVTISLWRT